MRTQCGHCTEIHTSLAALRDCARQHGYRTSIPAARPAAFEPAETAARAARAALTEADLYPGPDGTIETHREESRRAPAPVPSPAPSAATQKPSGDAWKLLKAGKYNVPGVGVVVVRISGTTDLPYASTRDEAGSLVYQQGLIRKMNAGQMIDENSEPEAGFYMINGRVHKVQRAIHGSGRMYAKCLDLESGEWERARGAVLLATEENRLTPEQAMQVAKECQSHTEWALYGRCFICGRTLTDEESISLGIGPVCIGKLGAAA